MKRLRKITSLVLVLMTLLAAVFSLCVFGEETEKTAISVNASDLTGQINEVSASENTNFNIVGILCWVVVALGILFIIYVLFSSNRKKKGLRPKQLKYRRSPYQKNHRKMESEYLRYKRNKYKG